MSKEQVSLLDYSRLTRTAFQKRFFLTLLLHGVLSLMCKKGKGEDEILLIHLWASIPWPLIEAVAECEALVRVSTPALLSAKNDLSHRV